jgi:hypothetical protein
MNLPILSDIGIGELQSDSTQYQTSMWHLPQSSRSHQSMQTDMFAKSLEAESKSRQSFAKRKSISNEDVSDSFYPNDGLVSNFQHRGVDSPYRAETYQDQAFVPFAVGVPFVDPSIPSVDQSRALSESPEATLVQVSPEIRSRTGTPADDPYEALSSSWASPDVNRSQMPTQKNAILPRPNVHMFRH